MLKKSLFLRAALSGSIVISGVFAGPAIVHAASAADANCPSAADLLTALQADAELFDAAGAPTTLTGVSCVLPYTTATTTPQADEDSSFVLFHYDSAGQVWQPVNVGTGDVCDESVPAEVAAQLDGCEPTDEPGDELPDADDSDDDSGTSLAAAVSSIGGKITRAEVLQRAQGWVDNQPGRYSQHAFSWDPTHTRKYRRDCSGYVGMALHLGSDPTTRTMSSVAHNIKISELRPGDLLNDPSHHVVLFKNWKADGRHFVYYTFGSTPVKIRTAAIDSGRIDSHPYHEYQAMRYDNIIESTNTPSKPGLPDAQASPQMVDYKNTLQTFYRGTDNSLQHYWYDSSWHHEKLGTGIAGKIATTVFKGTLQAYARGTDNSLQHYWYDSGWHHETLATGIAGDPTVLLYNNSLQTFSRGTDGTLQHVWYESAWKHESLGKNIAGDPTSITYNGSLQTFSLGTGATLQHIWYDNGSWKTESLGTGIAGDPSAMTYKGSLQTFVRGTDSTLQHIWYQSSAWHRETLARNIVGNPATTTYNNSLQTFARTTGNTLQHIWYDSSWHQESRGTDIMGDPAVIQYGTSLQTTAVGSSNSLRHLWYDGSWHDETLRNSATS